MATIATTMPVGTAHPAPANGPVPRILPNGLSSAVFLRRFSVREYQRMIDEGYFAGDEAYELIEGLIVHKMARDPIHDACLANANRVLAALLPTAGWHFRVQSAVVGVDSQPEPDLALTRGVEFDYLAHHPEADDVPLVIEVSNSSLADDRAWKSRVYASARFDVYWIINLIDSRVEVYSDPSGPDSAPAYRRRDDYVMGQSVPFNVPPAPGKTVLVRDLLPPAVRS
ncbi:MAG TPA: Uma2 family endonuclease [Tepidisphaeraceae bacterium]|nr:Uma2 family endonuclease [Tepidisphaeraceae bacterium]